jgi:hypothetical protein
VRLVFVLRGYPRTILGWSLVGANAMLPELQSLSRSVRTEMWPSYHDYPVLLADMPVHCTGARPCSCGFGTVVAAYERDALVRFVCAMEAFRVDNDSRAQPRLSSAFTQ